MERSESGASAERGRGLVGGWFCDGQRVGLGEKRTGGSVSGRKLVGSWSQAVSGQRKRSETAF